MEKERDLVAWACAFLVETYTATTAKKAAISIWLLWYLLPFLLPFIRAAFRVLVP
jgi:hypothetical protein